MIAHHANVRWRAVAGAGILAGIAATLAQVLLWVAFTNQFPAILFRDARLTAALILGARVLPPPPSFDLTVWVAATFIHFALSIAYTAVAIWLTRRLAPAIALLVGAGVGVVLYAVNLYGFTAVFPWFAQARGWITLIAHVAFGVSAIAAYRGLGVRSGRSRSGER